MIFSASYALSSVSIHQKGVRCIAVCKGVAKFARCRSMRLCQRSWPKNRPNAFAFFGVGDCMIASIFPRSTAIPSLLTMHPSRVPLVTLNAHLAGLRLSRVVRHHSKHNRRWCKWSFAHPVYRKIIQEYLQKGWDVLTEYFRNDSLEHCQRGF